MKIKESLRVPETRAVNISVRFCCITNHPQTLWLTQQPLLCMTFPWAGNWGWNCDQVDGAFCLASADLIKGSLMPLQSPTRSPGSW